MSSLIFYNGLGDRDAGFEGLVLTTVIFTALENQGILQHYRTPHCSFFPLPLFPFLLILNEPHNSPLLSAVSQQGQIL